MLGKALFWDQQAGSDGNACASCHQAAGTDLRITNQLSPGFNDVASGPGGDTTFGSTQSDTGFETGRGHQGAESCTPGLGVFYAGSHPVRQVEPRNMPTTVNAAFFFSNFWDGRANNTFNGVGVFGLRDIVGDPNKRLIVVENGVARLDYLQIKNASLASQAVAPPVSTLEMSCDGRTLSDLGRKLLSARPLATQQVDTTDSVLGPHANSNGKGLKNQHSYATLIMKSFDPKYWAASCRPQVTNPGPNPVLNPDGSLPFPIANPVVNCASRTPATCSIPRWAPAAASERAVRSQRRYFLKWFSVRDHASFAAASS